MNQPHKKPTRRSKKTVNSKAALSIYQSNINGIISKLDSFTKIIQKLSPDVIVLCELKHNNPIVLLKTCKKLGYTALVKKGSGLLIAAKVQHKMVNCTVTIQPNIMTGRITIKDTTIRIISVYGPQESCPINIRTDFYEELSAEIESCLLHNDSPIVIGDINAKIECINGKIKYITSNGKMLNDIIENHSLNVLNFHPICTGKWTRKIIKNKTT